MPIKDTMLIIQDLFLQNLMWYVYNILIWDSNNSLKLILEFEYWILDNVLIKQQFLQNFQILVKFPNFGKFLRGLPIKMKLSQ